MGGIREPRRQIFHLFLIKPSHYDDDGYVIQWLRSAIPSNTLATLNGLVADCRERRVLGEGVDIRVTAIDETNSRVRPARIVRQMRRDGGSGMVAFVGVQSNQFPHAVDLARPLMAAGIQVCIGGFHVSGCLAMLAELPADIRDAMDLGISIFGGEAEGRLEAVLKDAHAGRLRPLYNHMSDLPALAGAPIPILPPTRVLKTAGGLTSFDAGRGCPFQCSFCTIINVQGRKSRRRSADDIERIVRTNAAQGIYRYFITDDNLARNKDWEAIFDRLIRLREQDGIPIRATIQVDTLCHEIDGFIEKAARAGVRRVFIGLENINPESLLGAKKRQNRITDYRRMLQAWRAAGVATYAGYILGFPGDTPESIVRDIEIIKRELPVDLLEFFCLTPLPGSEDHQNLQQNGVWMDPDMNKYDLEHVTTGHPLMSAADWQRAYHLAWETYYTPEHMETVMRRAVASGMSPGKTMFLLLWFHGCKSLEHIHPLEGGYLRRKYRRDRRPGLPRESAAVFYPRYFWETVSKHARLLRLVWRLARLRRRLKRDPAAKSYTDLSLTPVTEAELDELEIFAVSDAAKAVVERKRDADRRRAKHGATA
ncbi:MAG: radical SAM protein [Alphaproteobacteria bacterium]|jgi:hypothetical protein|nr:radical SAM protein [Alphaproteobacteria bacterium]